MNWFLFVEMECSNRIPACPKTRARLMGILSDKVLVNAKSSFSRRLDLETRNDLELYVEFVGKPQRQVVAEILRKVFEMDGDFVEFKRSRPVRQKRNKSTRVESMPEAQSA